MLVAVGSFIVLPTATGTSTQRSKGLFVSRKGQTMAGDFFVGNVRVWYDEETGVSLRLFSGDILTKDQYKLIRRHLKWFYKKYTDEQIKNYNDSLYARAERSQEQHEEEYSYHQHYFSKKKTTPGYVYLIKSGEHYKIGRTKNLKTRVKSFETSLPLGATVVHSFETDDTTEAEIELHARFSDKRINGEWFNLVQDDVDYICTIQPKGSNNNGEQ